MRKRERAAGGPIRARGRLRAAACERGVALVEFALVAPVFMLLLLGMIDLGKAFNYWIDNTHMANLGARMVVVNTLPPGGLTMQQYIKSTADTGELKNGGTPSIPGGGLSVCVSYPDAGKSSVGEPVRVTVSATYHWLPLLGDKIGIATTKIRGTAEMRLEQTPTNTSVANNINAPC